MLAKIIIKWILYGLVIFIMPKIIPGIIVSGFKAALLTALIMGLVNSVIKPVIKLFAFPINIVTLGLFNFVVNTGLLFLVALLSPGFSILEIGSGFLGSIFIAFCSFFIETAVSNKDDKKD